MTAGALTRETIGALLSAGVRDFVLSPGSRNTPLSLQLADADSRGVLRLHVRIDERTAAFLALGLAKAGGRPVAVASTSGTAVANFHPAVVEASMSRTPIAVVTANRPLTMLGTGANQTIPQVGIFGASARATVHIDDQQPGSWTSALHHATHAMTASPAGPGPVQIDLGLAPPLLPGDLVVTGEQRAAAPVEADGSPARVVLPPRSLVVVGESSAAAAGCTIAAAIAAGFPVHVEAGTAMQGGTTGCLRAGAFLLRSAIVEQHRPTHLLVVGRPTLGRAIGALASSSDLDVTVVTEDPSITDPFQLGRPPLRGAGAVIEGRADDEFAEAWKRADAAAARVIDEETAGVFDAGAVAALVSAAAPDLLVVASSNPIRDLDERAVRRTQTVIVNRGAAGIDGLVSTAIGAALADQAAAFSPGPGCAEPPQRRSERTAVALLGDLAFVHDSTGLVIGPAEPRPNLTFVVVNNDGGAIFSGLEQGAPEHAKHFERVFGTPHGVDLERLCAATSTSYQRCGSGPDLADALEAAPDGIRVIEVRVSRAGERDRRRDFTDRVLAAIDATLAP